MNTPLLSMKGITKLFPGVKALDNVNFDVMPGEIHALCGENGAGKSTLMNILSGTYPYGSYDGDIIWQNEICRFANIKDSEKKGIVIIRQELALIPYMSIGENMFLGNERGYPVKINWDDTYKKAAEYLNIVGLKESPQTLIKDIGIGKQQLVEIVKALAKDVKLLILDEPTASLNEDDAQNLLKLLRKFKSEGMTSIIISHKLNEINQIADSITIIRDGATIETLKKGSDDISEPRIVKGMVGREIHDIYPKRPEARDKKSHDIALEAKEWTVYHPLYKGRKVCDRVNLKLYKGEVAGISGLMGSGRTELAMSIFGRSYGTNISGQLFINAHPIMLKSVREAINHKVAYITEDRKGNGLVLTESIRVNTTLADMKKTSILGLIINKKAEITHANELKKRFGVKSPDIEQHTGNLSGGNQQKVLLAKWMFTDPDILILDEPTRGVDVGAKHEIYTIINELAAQGKAILIISSEMPEVLGMCDRIYVMNEGRIIGELNKNEASQEAIMKKIIGS